MPQPAAIAPPRHIAVIMDGNGRWAQQRGLPRTAGHKQGIEALRRTVKAANDLGVDYLTVYSFSTENWTRPRAEVMFLLELFRRFVRQDVAELHASGIRICMIGIRAGLDKTLLSLIDEAEQLTAKNTGMTLVVAFNYGGRQEIVEAARKLVSAAQAGRIAPENINEESFGGFLDTAGWPEPDMLIRTGGEERVSNFLLWQCAYAEFIFMREFWPDFDADALAKAISIYHGRERRFGGLKAQSA